MKKTLLALLFAFCKVLSADAQSTFFSDLDGWCGTRYADERTGVCPSFTYLCIGSTTTCTGNYDDQWHRIGTPDQPGPSTVNLVAINTGGGTTTDYQCEGLFAKFAFTPGITYHIHIGVRLNDNATNSLKLYATSNLTEMATYPTCQDNYLEDPSTGMLGAGWYYNSPGLVYDHIGDIPLSTVFSGSPVDYTIDYTPTSVNSQFAFHSANDPGPQGDIIIDYVRIDYDCDPSFTYTISTQSPNTVNLFPSNTHYFQYIWAMGDPASTIVPLSAPGATSFTYNAIGSYNVCLNIKGSEDDPRNVCNTCLPICINAIKKDVIVDPSCTPDFALRINSSVPNLVFFDVVGGSAYTQIWDFGDGTTLTVPPYTTPGGHTYAAAGTYTVCLSTLGDNGKPCPSKCLTFCVDKPGRPHMRLAGPGESNTNNAVANKSIKVYPVPAVDKVNVDLSLAKTSDVSIRVVDGLGKVVLTKNFSQLAEGAHTMGVDVSGLANGMYYVNIKTDAGITVKPVTIIK